MLTCTSQELSFPPASGPAQTVCLITETHSSPLCRGRSAPPAYYHTVWELNHPHVCACVWDRESRLCVQKKHLPETSQADKGACLCPAPTAPSLSLSVSISFFLSGRCWLSGTKWKELVKLPPLLETQPFVPVKSCAFWISSRRSLFWRLSGWQGHITGSVCARF